MRHTTEWILVEAGTSLFEIIIIITFLSGFLTSKEMSAIKRITVLFGAYSLLFLVSTTFYNVPNALIVNFLVVSIIISLLLYSGKMTQRIFPCALLLAILSVVEIISLCLLVIMLNIEPETIQSNHVLKFIGVVIKNIFSFAIVKLICNFRRSKAHDVGRLYFIFLMAVPIICTGIALLNLQLVLFYNIENLMALLFSTLGLMYVNVIVFAIFEGLLRQKGKELTYKMIEKQLELQLTHYSKLAENRARISEVVHDFNNHMNCIYNLYKYEKFKELGDYIKNLIEVSNTEMVIDTGNPVIDALLNDKKTIAKEVGIEFKDELSLPSNLQIMPTDICAILGNSLDNAIEACKRIRNSLIRPEIHLSMTYHDSYLIIVVSNTIDEIPKKEGKFFRSSKPFPELHGYGMHSIERTVKKYDGNMVVKYDSGIFKLEIVMSTAC